MTIVFVTGSGTEVGKTFVCCQLIRALQSRYSIRALKPIATGFEPGELAASDTGRLLRAQSLPIEQPRVEATTPWRFSAALSPDMAAEREARSIPFSELVEFCTASDGADLTLIEGIGGVMVPIDARHTVLDWIARLDARVLLVAGSYLGTLSHTLTAQAALAERELDTRAVVVSESAERAVSLDATVKVLERFLVPTPVSGLPRQDPDAPLPAELVARWVSALGL